MEKSLFILVRAENQKRTQEQMGKPGKNKDRERDDTVFWTTLIVQHTGLTDAEIVERLHADDLVIDLESARRSFTRWRTGQRSMVLNDLADFVKRARAARLLPAGTGLKRAIEQRLFLSSTRRASVELARQAREFRALHSTRAAACKALEKYAAAIRAANDAEVLEPSSDDFDAVRPADIEKLIKELKRHVFFDLSAKG